MNKLRIDSYDGLKGVAILSVIAYHLFPSVIPGGFFLVNTFLVVGGFFFARSFEKIHKDTQGIEWNGVGNYVKKTIERLFIPLFWLILLIVVGLLLFAPIQLKFIRGDIFSGLFFVNNIFQIASDRSYFVQMTNASPFTHLWYNSIHLQSVLIAIAIMLGLQKLKLKVPIKGIIWLIIATISHLLVIFLYEPGQDPSRVYYGIETRFASFALGVAAAYVVPTILNLFYKWRYKRTLYNLVALIALIAAGYLVLTIGDQDPMTYLLWLSVFNLLSFLLVFSITVGSPVLTYLFSLPPLVYVGKRSYSYYLWYYPVIVFFLQQYRNLGENINIVIGLSIVAIFIIGELFYRYIEQDGLDIWYGTHFEFKEDLDEMAEVVEHSNYKQVSVYRFVGYVALLVLFVRGLFYSDNQKSLATFNLEYQMYQAAPKIQPAPHPLEIPIIETRAYLEAMEQELDTYFFQEFEGEEPVEALQDNYFATIADTAEISQMIDENQEYLDELREMNPEVADELTDHELLLASEVPVTFFGDSLIFISADRFIETFQEGNRWGQGSLQIWDALPILQDLVNEGFVKENLVVILGTNAGLDQDAMDEFMEIVGEERNVFFANTNSRVFHIDSVNDIIDDTVAEYDNAYLIDWYGHQRGNADWYTWDEVHFSDEGEDEFAILTAQTMFDVLGTEFFLRDQMEVDSSTEDDEVLTEDTEEVDETEEVVEE